MNTAVQDEVERWFFDDYLPTWIGVGSGAITRGPDFILDYWGAPLHWSDDEGSRCIPDEGAVVAQLAELQHRLRANGYADTAVPDRRVLAYHRNGAAIEVIWSRRRGDGSEIERLAVHFELARGPQGWRVVSIQATPTWSETLDGVWPQHH